MNHRVYNTPHEVPGLETMGIPNSINQEQILFSAPCNEKHGSYIRTVRAKPFTPELLNQIWDKTKDHPTFMGVQLYKKEDLASFFVTEHPDGTLTSKGLCAIVDDNIGLFWLTDINWPVQASVHYRFFDGIQRGREDLCRVALKWIFNTYDFNRLWTSVPLFAISPRVFVKKIGFKLEGRTRRSSYYKNMFYDTEIYGMLREEI